MNIRTINEQILERQNLAPLLTGQQNPTKQNKTKQKFSAVQSSNEMTIEMKPSGWGTTVKKEQRYMRV